MQSCDLRKWFNNLWFSFCWFARGRVKDRCGGVIAHIYCIILYYIPYLSCNKSAKFLILNVYFAEDNHEENEDKIK